MVLKIPKVNVIRKNVTRAKVTIAETRFDIKIPLNMSSEEENGVIKYFTKICEETWHPGMITYRESIEQ